MSQRPRPIELGQEPVWEIQFDETLKQYRAFCLYRDLLDTRTIAKVAAAWMRDPDDADAKKAKGKPNARNLEEWSRLNRWVERAEQYDLYLERKRREDRETDIVRMQRTEAALGRAAVGLALTRIIGDPTAKPPVPPISPSELTAGEVAMLGKFGIEASRLSTNRPTTLIAAAFMMTKTEATQMSGDLVEILMRHIPEERRPIAAEEVRAYAFGERRMLGQ